MADSEAVQELLRKAKAYSDAEFNTSEQQFYQPNPEFQAVQQRLSPESFKERNQRKLGAPLDTEQGAPFLQRVGAAFRTEPEQVIKYWQDLYGKGNVKVLDNGDVAVRVLGDDGKPKFLAVDEDKLTVKDVDTLIGVAPEIIGTYAAIRTGNVKLPTTSRFWQWARDLALGSTGAELAGAAKDISVRSMDQMPIEPGEVLKRRMLQGVPADIALGTGFALGTKILGKIITPFGGEIPAVQFDAEEAARYWNSRLPADKQMTYSAGQKTGSTFLLRSEAEQKRLPGASGLYNDLRAQQNDSIKAMQEITMGAKVGTLPSIEAVNERVQRVLRNELEPQEQLIANARSKLVGEAHDEAMRIIDSQTIPIRMDRAEDVGRTVRNKVLAERADFQNQASLRYDAVRAMPGGSDRILAPGNLAQKATDYLANKLPSKDVITTVDVGVVGPTGKPILRTETGKEVLREFVPDGVVNRLKALAASGDTKFSLQDLIEMRNDVYNAIAEGEAIPGVRTHHLGEIKKMLTSGIQDAIDSIPNKSLRSAYESAEQYYKNGVERFHTRLISTIMKEPTAPGAIGDKAVFDRVIRGEDSIAELKNFLGASSPEFKMVKRGIADEIYRQSMNVAQDTLNAKVFLRNLESLAKDQPAVFDEVFGLRGKNLLQQAQLMTIGQSDKIEAAVLDQGIRNPNAIPKLRELIQAQRDQDKLYKNKILKAIGSNTLPGEGIEPNQFLNRFVDSAAPEQVSKVMNMLESADPETARIVRAKAVQKLLSETGQKPGPMDKVALLVDENRVMNTQALQEFLRDPEKKKTYTALIGKDGMEMLDMMAKAVRPIESADRTFSAAGGIAGGIAVNQAWQGGIMGFADKALHNFVGGALLTTPGVRHIISNNLMTPERTHSLFKFMLYSEPVVKSIYNDYRETAPYVIQRMNEAIDGNLGRQLDAGQQQIANTNSQAQKALQLLESLRSQRIQPIRP